MQQLTFIKPGLLEWWDVPTPQLEGLDDALVRPVAVATCDLDGVIIRGQVPFTGPEMYTTGVTFKTGRVQARPIIPTILELVRDGRIQPERVTSALVPWEDALEALRDPPTKLVIARALRPKGENGRQREVTS